jgi:hypothetical protein
VTRRRAAIAGLVLLLELLFLARLIDTAAAKSLSVDEPHYIARGLHLWQTGRYHFQDDLRLQPPLAFHLASLPLIFFELDPLPDGEDIGLDLLERETPGPGVLRFASRLPFVLLACWGALLCFFWAREAAGDAAGLLALGLYSFSPSVLAHAPLAHSDLAVSVFYLQTLYAWWRFTRRPSGLRLAACGVSLGLALATKLSGVLLLPILGLLCARAVWRPGTALAAAWPAGAVGRAGRGAASYVALLALAAGVVWLAYGGSWALATDPHGVLPDWRLPGYLRALLWDVRTNAAGRPVYFLGEVRDAAPWCYLPVAFALKLPLGTLALIALALVSPARGGVGAPVGVAVGFYAGVAVVAVVSPLGIRYLLPILPPLFVLIATRLAAARGWRRAALALCGVWIAAASLRIHPDYLAYFNELAGGPAGGDRYLIESNLDWGQDLPALAAELAARSDGSRVFLAYFGPEPPARYGIRGRPLPCRPVHGRVAISVDVLHDLYDPGIPFERPPADCHAWLRELEPVARPGYSIHVYETPPLRRRR